MQPALATCVFLVSTLLAAAPVLASEPAPGKTATVTCRGAPDQKYACYLPSAYTPKKAWPILYCFSPNAAGGSFVSRYRKVCEERGWIVVGSMNSRNGPWAPIQAAIDAIWADTKARFMLSKTMRYASGFSGGARVSFALAEMKAEHIAGVIAIGAGLHSRGKMPAKKLACFLTCGETDPNKRELDPLFDRLKKAGNPVALARSKSFWDWVIGNPEWKREHVRHKEVLQEQLAGALKRLHPETRFGVITFMDGFKVKRIGERRMLKNNTRDLKAARRFLDVHAPKGFRSVLANLATAMEMAGLDPKADHALGGPQADTVYVFSDGSMRGGRFLYVAAELAAFERLNRFRRLVVHTIRMASGGSHSEELMKGYAASTGGTYHRFRKP